eukprot:3489052-Rhodomonas_salina.1
MRRQARMLTPIPGINPPMDLCTCYALSGTDIGHAATRLAFSQAPQAVLYTASRPPFASAIHYPFQTRRLLSASALRTLACSVSVTRRVLYHSIDRAPAHVRAAYACPAAEACASPS